MAKNTVSDKQVRFERGDGRMEATSQTPLLPIAYPPGAVNGYVWTTDANGNGSWQAASGGGGGGTSLTRATPLTASGSAAANTIVPVITTSGAVTVTLPNAPAAGTVVAVKCITFGTGNAVTIACAGSDVINKSGGGTTLTLSAANQGVYLCYDLVSGIWTDLADDLPTSYLDTLFLQLTGGTMAGVIAMGGNKITGLANGSASTDAAAFGQVMSLVATTGAAGYALVNGTGTIISWTAPSDGNLHRVIAMGAISVSNANETGGQVQFSGTIPNSDTIVTQFFPGGLNQYAAEGAYITAVIGSGQTAELNQSTALTGGASSTLWAEIWGS